MQKPYTLEEFMADYELDAATATRLYKIAGPSKADLAIFMAARADRQRLKEWAMDPWSTQSPV